MKLLDQLTAAGGLGTNEVVARSVEWNGQTIPLHFRDLPGAAVVKLLKHEDSDARIVLESVCEEDGTQALTLDQVHAMKIGLRSVIVREAMDVFGFSKNARAAEKKD
jgi:hypothetical protein